MANNKPILLSPATRQKILKLLNNLNRQDKIWITNAGDAIPYKDLTDKHLDNIINMLKKKDKQSDHLVGLVKEKQKRIAKNSIAGKILYGNK